MNGQRGENHLWLPFTNMREFCNSPLILRSGDASIVSDVDGNQYIDCISSLWHVGVGHANPFYIERLSRQMQNGMTSASLFGVMHEAAVEFAKRLVDFIQHPYLTKVFLASGGSEAVETALKLAIQYNRIRGRKGKKISYLNRAYHGVSMGALSAMGLESARRGYEDYLSDHFIAIDNPYCYRCPYGDSYPACSLKCAAEFESVIRKHGNEITALIVEPVQGAGGIIVPPKGYLSKLVGICRKYDVLVIFDEVVTGFWRTGNKFAFNEEDCFPDLLVLSKGISGGYAPLGACVIAQYIYDAFERNNEVFRHGNTYAGSPLACAAGVAHIDYVSDKGFQRRLGESMQLFHVYLEDLREHPCVGDVRYKGMMAGIELVEDKTTKKPYVSNKPLAVIGRKHGLLLRPLENIVTLFPVLNIDTNTMDRMFSSLREMLVKIDGEIKHE